MDRIQITAVVLTKNEEQHIDRCLQSLQFCDEILVVDDCSTDQTVKIAGKYKTRVVQRALNNDFTSQRNFAQSEARGEWILYIDADEEVSIPLKNEINKALNDDKLTKRAYYIPRRDYWWGKELKFGEVAGARSKGFIRLVKKNSGKWMGKVHERFIIGSFVGRLNNFINHYPHPTVKDFIEEVNHYSTIRAQELYAQGKYTNIFEILINPFGKFIYTYFILFGFLDGAVGFAYSFFMSFHSFLVRAKLYQYREFGLQNT